MVRIIVKTSPFAAARIKKGYSQRGLAKKIQRAISYICQIEKGSRNPSPEAAKEICEVLEVEFDDLFFIESVRKSEQTQTA